MAIFLRETDVDRLLNMREAMDAVAEVFKQHAQGQATNIHRGRGRCERSMLHLMGASSKVYGMHCVKMYTSTADKLRFLLHLYDGESGELLAVMEADRLGRIRTGATTGVATETMACRDSNTVGIFGCGRQAKTQLEAVCLARDIVEIYVYGRKAERREKFAMEMSATLGIRVVPVATPQLAAEDKDIVITATDSSKPVLMGEWLGEGTHLNVVGSNFIGKAEVDVEAIRRCQTIVVDDREQAKMEAGDFALAVEEGVIRWSNMFELGTIVLGRESGRHKGHDVTMFKSVGCGIEDLAVARLVYQQAIEEGAGEKLPY